MAPLCLLRHGDRGHEAERFWRQTEGSKGVWPAAQSSGPQRPLACSFLEPPTHSSSCPEVAVSERSATRPPEVSFLMAPSPLLPTKDCDRNQPEVPSGRPEDLPTSELSGLQATARILSVSVPWGLSIERGVTGSLNFLVCKFYFILF